MTLDKLLKLGFIALVQSGAVLVANVGNCGAPAPIAEPPNLVDKPEYDVTQPCMEGEKLQYFGIEPLDSYFTSVRSPAVLRGGIFYEEQDELYVGGNPSLTLTHQEIIEGDAKTATTP